MFYFVLVVAVHIETIHWICSSTLSKKTKIFSKYIIIEWHVKSVNPLSANLAKWLHSNNTSARADELFESV